MFAVPIGKFLECSILHLPPEQQRQIMDDDGGGRFSSWPSGYGAFVFVSEPDVLADLPASVTKIFGLARERGCRYVLFDRDADPLDGFEMYRPYCDECDDQGCEHCEEANAGCTHNEATCGHCTESPCALHED